MKYHISDKEYDMIQKDMQEENRNSLLFFSVITILFLFVMLLISFYSPVFVRFRSAYILLMLVAVLILAGTYMSKNKNPAILLFDMYAFEIMLYVFAVILGAVAQPQEQAVSMIAFLLTVPFLFIDKPLRMICSSGLADRSLVGEKTIQRLRNDEEYPTSVQTVLALCVGLKLPLPEAEMFLGKTDFKLNSLKGEGYVYQCVMGACAENSIYEINEMLKENGITPLGSDPDLQ